MMETPRHSSAPPCYTSPTTAAAAAATAVRAVDYSTATSSTTSGSGLTTATSTETINGIEYMPLPTTSSNSKSGIMMARREVNRSNLHPVFKLEWLPLWLTDVMEKDIASAMVSAMALVISSPILIPILPFIVLMRKRRWKDVVKSSQEEYGAAFEETTRSYRQSQRDLVDHLLTAQSQSDSTTKATTDLPQVIAVTMATGQEGQGVVRALAESTQFQNAKILALVRNPESTAAKALANLSPRIELVQCDSTNVASLESALQPAHAVYLATTLNRASAGHWDMKWDGNQYQIQQGKAFAQACSDLLAQEQANLRHIVYGTAPLRKWPVEFVVEPPIHYAAKWKVEDILEEANLPVTYLRKCPYHENFTKLTKAKSNEKSRSGRVAAAAAMMGVEGGGAFVDNSADTDGDGSSTTVGNRKIELEPGKYQIKAFTSPTSNFVYNMMDPRDAGKWAALAFQHPNLLIGQSLSVASDALTGPQMAQVATDCGALGEGVTFDYSQQPRWLFETLAFVEPTFVYISGLQRWSNDGGIYDLDTDGVNHVMKLMQQQQSSSGGQQQQEGLSTWADHLDREGLGQFTETMADLLPDYTKAF